MQIKVKIVYLKNYYSRKTSLFLFVGKFCTFPGIRMKYIFDNCVCLHKYIYFFSPKSLDRGVNVRYARVQTDHPEKRIRLMHRAKARW